MAACLCDCPLNDDHLAKFVSFQKENSVEGWYSIPADGFRTKTTAQWERYLDGLRLAGTEYLEFTLFGKEETHNWFVGRKDSYPAIDSLAQQWHRQGGKTIWSLFVHKKNLSELVEVRSEKSQVYGLECPVVVWDYLGRGVVLDELRVEQKDLDFLPVDIQQAISSLDTEREWVDLLKDDEDLPFAQEPDIIKLAVGADGVVRIPFTTVRLGHQGLPIGCLPDDTVEKLMCSWEETYHSWLSEYPKIGWLAQKYGDANSEKLYDKRNMVRKWCHYYKEKNPCKSV